MLKTLFITTATIIILFVLFAMMCTMIVAGRSDEQANKENVKEADKMFWKKQLCPKCKTGKDSYDLDKLSENCPYIECFKNGKCQFYVPLEKAHETKNS